MTLERLLKDKSSVIVRFAERGIRTVNPGRFESDGEDRLRRQLECLLLVIRRCIQRKDLTPMLRHTDKITQRRLFSSYELCVAQTTFNALEEAIWMQIIGDMEPGESQDALSAVSAVIGIGKEAVARSYASRSSGSLGSSYQKSGAGGGNGA